MGTLVNVKLHGDMPSAWIHVILMMQVGLLIYIYTCIIHIHTYIYMHSITYT